MKPILLIAKYLTFAAHMLWVLGWLWSAIMLVPLLEVVLDHTYLLVWYIATVVIIGAAVANRGLRYIGTWEKENDR